MYLSTKDLSMRMCPWPRPLPVSKIFNATLVKSMIFDFLATRFLLGGLSNSNESKSPANMNDNASIRKSPSSFSMLNGLTWLDNGSQPENYCFTKNPYVYKFCTCSRYFQFITSPNKKWNMSVMNDFNCNLCEKRFENRVLRNSKWHQIHR